MNWIDIEGTIDTDEECVKNIEHYLEKSRKVHGVSIHAKIKSFTSNDSRQKSSQTPTEPHQENKQPDA